MQILILDFDYWILILDMDFDTGYRTFGFYTIKIPGLAGSRVRELRPESQQRYLRCVICLELLFQLQDVSYK